MLKILLTKEVAEMLRVSEEHVRELIREQQIRAYKEGKRGGYRIELGEVQKYIRSKYAMVLKKDSRQKQGKA